MSDLPYRTAPRREEDDPPTCLYCGGEIDRSSNACKACHAPIRRREAVSVMASGCPRCGIALEAAGVAGARVFRCERCHGAFVDHVAWSRIVGAVRSRSEVDLAQFVPPPPPLAPAEAALVPMIPCPACLRPMERFTFGARSKTTADACEPHGLWLDAAELAAVLAFVQRLWEAGGVIPMTREEWQDLERGRLSAADAIADGERRWLDEVARRRWEEK